MAGEQERVSRWESQSAPQKVTNFFGDPALPAALKESYVNITTMPIRQLKRRKRVIKREEQISMHESAKAAAERYRQEKERLIAEGKLRRELIKVDARTTIVRYIPIEPGE